MSISLKATKREELGKKVGVLREQLLMPAVLYGHNITNKNISLSINDFIKVYKEAGTSTLIDLKIGDDEMTKVIIVDIQRDPVLHTFIHADFQQINMKEEITTEVSLEFVGESSAVKSLGGVLVKSMEHVNIRCLPADLPHSFIIDLSKIKDIDDHFAVKDLEVPSGVIILNDPEDVLVVVKSVKVEKEPEIEKPLEASEIPKAGEKAEKKEDAEKKDVKK